MLVGRSLEVNGNIYPGLMIEVLLGGNRTRLIGLHLYMKQKSGVTLVVPLLFYLIILNEEPRCSIGSITAGAVKPLSSLCC